MEHLSLIVSALIGAIIGSLGAELLGHFLRRRRRKRDLNELLVKQYLSQFQYFSESLWHRFENTLLKPGRSVMTPKYFQETTLYGLAGFLAYKRIMVLEGVYSQLEQLDLNLKSSLKYEIQKTGGLLDAIGYSLNSNFFTYDRLALAESVLKKDNEVWRVIPYLEFREKYLESNNKVEALKSAQKFVENLWEKSIEGVLEERVITFMNEVAKIILELSKETKISTEVKIIPPDVKGWKIHETRL